VPEHVSEGILAERLGQLIVTRLQLRLIVFDVQGERIVRWTR
jgi:limonene-1,2-epoxide hydrolase